MAGRLFSTRILWQQATRLDLLRSNKKRDTRDASALRHRCRRLVMRDVPVADGDLFCVPYAMSNTVRRA